MTSLLFILILLSSLWIAYGFLSTYKIKEPKYKTLLQSTPFEIRSYDSYVIASVDVQGSYQDAGRKGFRLIANYIFGQNQNQTNITMTACCSKEKRHFKYPLFCNARAVYTYQSTST
jgi:hypothetical protein